MECIKVLFELKHLSTQMDIDFLKHFFKTFDPDKSVSLNVTLQNIHIKKIDAADFRSAYYQVKIIKIIFLLYTYLNIKENIYILIIIFKSYNI